MGHDGGVVAGGACAMVTTMACFAGREHPAVARTGAGRARIGNKKRGGLLLSGSGQDKAIGRAWVASVLLLSCLAGCALQEPLEPSAAITKTVTPVEETLGWSAVRFRLHWPEGQEPRWYPDLFIADRVVGPVLDAERGGIALWRFHRRAARDGAGRQFSFLFYTTPKRAREINQRIAASPDLARWQRLGIIDAVVYQDPSSPGWNRVEGTSDRSWSPPMQRAWPYFIMGVSQLWLELIRELSQAPALPKQPQARYARISERMDQLWREEGSHALLHHLNAIFGYRELEVVRREVDLMRF